MRRLLIVSPCFPPVNTPDMQRVRMSLPYFRQFGWDPIVLAVSSRYVEAGKDPQLLESLPTDVPVHRVRALPAKWTRKLGLGAVGLRAFPFLHREGLTIIRRYNPYLVFFSTTAFPVMALGRIWKRKTRVPFVLDIQDPWVPEPEQKHEFKGGFKHTLMARIHGRLEPWTMRETEGVIAVSKRYPSVLRSRYPWLSGDRCVTLPFGADPTDQEIARSMDFLNEYFEPGNGLVHGVYIGRLGADMTYACSAVCRALQRGLAECPEIYNGVRIHFIGTDYGGRELTVKPVAEEFGVDEHVREFPERVPYFTALRLQQEADFLVVPGSMDATYIPSKIYSSILTGRPMVAFLRENGVAVAALRAIQSEPVVTFRGEDDFESSSERLSGAWSELLKRLPYTPEIKWDELGKQTAREMTRFQCDFFKKRLEI